MDTSYLQDEYGILKSNNSYKIIKAFTDFSDVHYNVGEELTFIGSNFSPYEDGLSLFFTQDDKEFQIMLCVRPDYQKEISNNLDSYFIESRRSEQSGLSIEIPKHLRRKCGRNLHWDLYRVDVKLKNGKVIHNLSVNSSIAFVPVTGENVEKYSFKSGDVLNVRPASAFSRLKTLLLGW